MDINKENIDDLNAVISINLQKDDYEEKVVKSLKDYKKTASMKGFRPGKVPFGLISKMYRKPVVVEEVNKLVSESLMKYINDEKIDILGEPILHEDEVKPIDWDNDEDFEFKFDIGITPELDIKLNEKTKIPFYIIKPDDELINKYIDAYANQMGSNVEVDIAEENDLIKADLTQLDENGQPLEEGLKIGSATMYVKIIKDEGIKKDILGSKKDDVKIIDLKKAFPNDTELAGLLNIDKEQVGEIEGSFEVKIISVLRFQNAEINQELFDKAFGEGNVKSEEEFREKVKEQAVKGLENDSEYKFKIDVRENLLKQFKSGLPTDFLKRWLLTINEGKFTKEDIENEFESFESMMKWQIIVNKIMKENDLKIEREDMESAAIEEIKMRFSQYGMANLPDESYKEFAGKLLENKEEARKLMERAAEEKVYEFVKKTVKIDNKEISSEKFNKLLEK